MVWEVDNLENRLRVNKEKRSLLLKGVLPKLVSDYFVTKTAYHSYKENRLSPSQAAFASSWVGASVYAIKKIAQHSMDIYHLRQLGAQEDRKYER